MAYSICVYCASSNDIDTAYHGVAATLGREMAKRGHTLIYGGGGVGLMGVVARAVMAGGGRVEGVIPRALLEMEVGNTDCDELIVTDDMRSRKAEMDRRADAFVVLPGGFGTLEELFETITHRLLGYHDKPIVIVNDNGFYDPLVELMEHMYAHRFAREKSRRLYRVVNDVAATFGAMDEQMAEGCTRRVVTIEENTEGAELG